MADHNKVHLMGICGMGMGSLALLLQSNGYKVQGSDENIYPPMSDQLIRCKIPIFKGYRPENLNPSPDLVIVGNVIRRDNPEAQALLASKIPYCSMPDALYKLFLKDRYPIVVAGTHGKSTTSTLATWILDVAGENPGAFIGAVSLNWGNSYRSGKGKYFVVEGDEYDSAFFDKGAKLFHYPPKIAILTSVEFDHADIFKDFSAVKKTFSRFLESVPNDGAIIANWFDPVVRELTSRIKGPRVLSYGDSGDITCKLENYATVNQNKPQFSGKMHFSIQINSDVSDWPNSFSAPLYGFHNLQNTLAVLLLAQYLEISAGDFQKGLDTFRGLKRRQEIVGEAGGVLIIDDFAHHPTAVSETLKAMKDAYPARRLVAVFEPRSNSSRRNIFQKEYEEAFEVADAVYLKEPPERGDLKSHEKLDTRRLLGVLETSNKEAALFDDSQTLLRFLAESSKPGDLVLFMSNAAFDGLPAKLFEILTYETMTNS